MRIDKYTMAQSWMRQDDPTAEEAKATWDTLEKEFEDKRKILLASAETDEIIKTIDDKFGPGTLFPASEAPIPPMTDQQAIREWEERNRKADGGQLVAPSDDGSRPGYSGKKYVTYDGIKYPVITKEGHPHEGKIIYRSRTKGTEYLDDKDALIKRRKLYKRRTNVGRFTAQELKDFKAKITTPEVGHLNLVKDKGIYRIQAGYGGGNMRSFPATEEGIFQAQDHIIEVYKKKYPNALLDSEFLKLRLSDENINLTSKQFAEKLNSENYTTKQGKKWKAGNVFNANTRLNISEQANPKHIREYSLKQVKEIIRGTSGGQAFINANINNESVLKKEAARLLANKRSANSFFLGFPTSDNNPSKLWRNLYMSSTKGDRIKVKGNFNGKDLANPANWPKKEDGSIDWRKKGKDNIPFYQKIQFQDTQAPNKAIFKWDKTVEGGNLKNQIDSVFGDGFFKKSTQAYDQQALDRRTMIKTKDGLKSINEILGEKIIIAEAKANNIIPTKEYIAQKKKTFALKDVHHNKGIANDPYSTEVTSRWANRMLGKHELDLAEGRITKDQFIKNIKNIAKTEGGIRFEVDDVMMGKKATTPSIYEKAMEKGGIRPGTRLYNQINQLTGGDPKLNKFVSQNFMSSGLSGPFEMLSDDLKRIINSDGFKKFSNNPALKKTLAAGKLPTKLYGPLDLVLGYFDYQNNRQKGFSVGDSIAHAGDMMLFGITDFGKDADVAGVKEIALKNGMSSEVFDGLVSANKNQNEVQNIITNFAALNKQSEDLIASGMGDKSIEYGILEKKKKDSQERLKVLMAEAIKNEPSLRTNLQVQEAGAPININVDKGKAFADLSKASSEFVQKRIDESDLENIAKQDDTTMGKIGAATKMTIGDPEWWLNLSLNQPWKKTAAMKRFEGMDQLKREDPTLYYKMLLSEGVDPHRNMNIPVRLEFEMKNPEFGTPISSHIKSQSYFDGGIASLRRKK